MGWLILVYATGSYSGKFVSEFVKPAKTNVSVSAIHAGICETGASYKMEEMPSTYFRAAVAIQRAVLQELLPRL